MESLVKANFTSARERLKGPIVVVLSGAEIQGPRVAHGPFLLSDPRQIDEAIRRYASGAMGKLDPRPEN